MEAVSYCKNPSSAPYQIRVLEGFVLKPCVKSVFLEKDILVYEHNCFTLPQILRQIPRITTCSLALMRHKDDNDPSLFRLVVPIKFIRSSCEGRMEELILVVYENLLQRRWSKLLGSRSMTRSSRLYYRLLNGLGNDATMLRPRLVKKIGITYSFQ